MPKPAQLPVWATDLSNNTEPSGGQKATGWTANQVAVSSYFNWLFYTIYLWIAYLDAGIWDGDLTVDGNLTVTGNTTVDTDLVVTGESTLTGGIANNVTLTLGATAAAGQHITISGNGKYKHGGKSLYFAWTIYDAMVSTSGPSNRTAGFVGIEHATNTVSYYRLPPLLGEQRLLGVTLYTENISGVQFTLMKADPTDGTVGVEVTGAINQTYSGGTVELTPDTPAADGLIYFVKVDSTGDAAIEIYGGVLSYDVP